MEKVSGDWESGNQAPEKDENRHSIAGFCISNEKVG
jgi:hypothetical protein